MTPDVQAARIAVDADPQDITHRLHLARTLMEAAWLDAGATWKANYEEAAVILESLLTMEPDNVVALVNLGVALSDQGFHARALEYYRRAESLDWVDGNLQFTIGVALVNLEDGDSGSRYFQESTNQSDRPDTIRAYFDPQAH